MPKPTSYNHIKYHQLPKSTLSSHQFQALLITWCEFEAVKLLPTINQIKAFANCQQHNIQSMLQVHNLCSMTVTHTIESDTTYKISVLFEISPTHFHTEMIVFLCLN